MGEKTLVTLSITKEGNKFNPQYYLYKKYPDERWEKLAGPFNTRQEIYFNWLDVLPESEYNLIDAEEQKHPLKKYLRNKSEIIDVGYS